MKNEYNICFAPDDNYAVHCAAAMASISANAAPGEFIKFHILHSRGFSAENIAKLKSLNAGKSNFSVNFIQVGANIFKDLPNYGHEPVWYRLKIPSLLEADKVLYLDCDIIVPASLGGLFAIDIENFALAAVKDNIYKKLGRRFKLPKSQPYFNSGVCLINCRYWREHNLEAKFFEYIAEDPHRAWLLDQTILNILFGAQTKIIPLKYNFQYVPRIARESCFILDRAQYREALKSPVVIHFFDEFKPWLAGLGAMHPMQGEYFKYLQMTPWRKTPEQLGQFLKENKGKRLKTFLKLCLRAFKRNPQFLFKPYFWGRIFM